MIWNTEEDDVLVLCILYSVEYRYTKKFIQTYFIFYKQNKMKNYNTVTLKDINKLLKENSLYFIINNYTFNWKDEEFKIKKIEYDRESNRIYDPENRWNFYLMYDDEIENISEWIMYDENKQSWLWFLYTRLQRLIEEWKKVFYTSKTEFATDWTQFDF